MVVSNSLHFTKLYFLYASPLWSTYKKMEVNFYSLVPVIHSTAEEMSVQYGDNSWWSVSQDRFINYI